MSSSSAVIVLYEKTSHSLILTERARHLRHHPGEICFPGGLWEKQDSDLWATAIREVYEELGIRADRITLLQKLNPEKTRLGVLIHPWFASIEQLEPYVLDPQEVASVIKIPLHEVVRSLNYQEISIPLEKKRIKTWQFLPSEHFIWGATVRIMKQLGQVLDPFLSQRSS